MKKDANQAPKIQYVSKKCYECFTHLPLNATVCNVCGKKVGPVDKSGKAAKPINIRSYISAAIAVVIFLVVLWFGFVRT